MRTLGLALLLFASIPHRAYCSPAYISSYSFDVPEWASRSRTAPQASDASPWNGFIPRVEDWEENLSGETQVSDALKPGLAEPGLDDTGHGEFGDFSSSLFAAVRRATSEAITGNRPPPSGNNSLLLADDAAGGYGRQAAVPNFAARSPLAAGEEAPADPVSMPEPTSLVLVTAGAATVILLRRRKG